nr:MAG TPA: hypothetical protein [Caudoviricetes sp.]
MRPSCDWYSQKTGNIFFSSPPHLSVGDYYSSFQHIFLRN